MNELAVNNGKEVS